MVKQCGTWFPETDHQCGGIKGHPGECQDEDYRGLNTDKLKRRINNAFREHSDEW